MLCHCSMFNRHLSSFYGIKSPFLLPISPRNTPFGGYAGILRGFITHAIRKRNNREISSTSLGVTKSALRAVEYEVTAELTGFKQQVRRGVTLAVAQEAVVNLTLDVGDIKEQITVTEEAQIVNTTMSSTSGLVTGEQVKDLPLNGRSFLELMRLNSDVIGNRSNTANGDQPSFSIAGRRPDQNRFTINGMDYVGNNAAGVYTSPQGISGYLLGGDAVREFNVLGHTYGAEYGKRAGAQVTIVTTSGTNQWRGSVFRVFAQQRAGHAELLRRGQCAKPDPGTTVPTEPVWQGVRQWSYRLGGEVDRWLAMERDL